jgi:lycopene beta-cyclase
LKSHYDYIITGAGCAGLSLLINLLQHSGLSGKSILLIDKSCKTENDRTWCFWEKEPDLFESTIHQRWNKLNFYSETFTAQIQMAPYHYKLIRGVDFYKYCFEIISHYPNVHVEFAEVNSIGNEQSRAFVELSNKRIYCDLLFNSILFEKISRQADRFLLLQHFKGWVIKTNQSTFDATSATLMDFRTSQVHGNTFFYVMPVSSTEALVEYTLFSPSLLEDEEYNLALKEYISQQLNISQFEILHQEFGVIPMTNSRFEKKNGNILNIGTAGGVVKPSSGYAFKFIQKQSRQIAESLANGGEPDITFSTKFNYYDSVFLNVLTNHPQKGADIFTKIFKHNSPETIFKFLDNESSLSDDLKIILPLTSGAFMKAGLQELLK